MFAEERIEENECEPIEQKSVDLFRVKFVDHVSDGFRHVGLVDIDDDATLDREKSTTIRQIG